MDTAAIRSENRIKNYFLFFIMVTAGISLNIGGVHLNSYLGLPFYFDNMGTILTAIMGGYLPCILVGFLYNIIQGISDPITTYYCFISVLIALAAAYYDEKGYLRKFPEILIPIIVFAVMGGGVGSFLTWFLYGFGFGYGISVSLGDGISAYTGMDSFASDMLANFIIDIADKAISTAAAVLVYYLIPQKVKNLFHPIKQQIILIKPKNRDNRGFRFSLRKKVLLLVAVSATLVAVAAVSITVIQYYSSAVEEYTLTGTSITKTVSDELNVNKIDEYMQKGRGAEGYKEFEKMLYNISRCSPEVKYIYIYKVQNDGCRIVFYLDSEQKTEDLAGVVIEHDEVFSEHLSDFLSGKEIEPQITAYYNGDMLSVYHPVNDKSGNNICYVCAGMSMQSLQTEAVTFLIRIFSVFVGVLTLILVFTLRLASKNIIVPIDSISTAAGSLSYDTPKARKESVEKIRSLNINTGDEIENLYNSIRSSTEDMVMYIEESLKKSKQIAKLQNGLILVLADIVESRDKCTGDHIRKTAAYTEIIMKQMKKDGIYSDQITDEFIEDVVHSAPLHDIGKIHVPDSLLNKPGRLTDEEFKIMQNHTTAGKEIIEKAIASVAGDSGYLKEAENLAAYHHEKWNGKGYPTGLSGEDIPLSARIMAVADVFDALVSRRSYKPPFNIDKAIEIIKTDAGTHFDAKIVTAFLNAEEEIRKVAGSYSDN